MELRQLRYFIKAKEVLNFTEASKQLYISQSTLSQQIKQLEDEIGVPLFNRLGKRITLTEAGELFAVYARNSIKSAGDGLVMIKDLNDLNLGSISVGVTFALRNILTKAVIRFSKKFPNIKIKIVFETSAQLLEKLKNAELDFVLTFKEAAEDETLNYLSVLRSPMSLVVSKKSEYSRKKTISLNDIAGLPLALPDSGYSTTQYINDQFKINDIQPDVLIEINDVPTLLELVKSGLWCTILADISVTDDQLATIPISDENMLREATIISLRDAYQKKSVKVLQEYLFHDINLIE